MREQRRVVRELADELAKLEVRGPQAVEYAERLFDQGIRSAADISEVPNSVLDAVGISGQERARLLAFSRLAAMERISSVPQRARFLSDSPVSQSDISDEDDDEATQAAREETFNIGESQANARVDAVLAALLPPLSRTYFGSLATDGLVKVNDIVVKKSARVALGDRLRVKLRAERELTLTAEPVPLSPIFEDEHCIVINKEAGVVVHPAPGNWNGTVVNGLLHRMREQIANSGGGEHGDLLPDVSGTGLRPGIVHRLDKFTTGALVAAKTARSQRALLAAFAERRVWKVYLAVCVGDPPDRSVVDAPIGRHPSDRLRMAVCDEVDGGRAALSVVHKLATDGRISLVAVLIRTGRTHQIRVHLQHLRHPVLGDATYGDQNWNRLEAKAASRPILHACTLRFAHPVSGDIVHAIAPCPPDLRSYAERLSVIPSDAVDEWVAERLESQFAQSLDGFKF